jgi:Ca2+-binding EF-hand superfamily protein
MTDKLEDVKKLFRKCDTNNNGTIEWDEFCAVLDKLIGEKTLLEKSEIFGQIDTNNSGMISFDEFCAWWEKQ